MNITSDAVIYFHLGPLAVSATLTFTWLIMGLMAMSCLAVARVLRNGDAPSLAQNSVESVVLFFETQARDVLQGRDPGWLLPFTGSLFLFIAVSNTLAVVPGFIPPTGSLSTTAALALVTFLAVPVYGIRRVGLGPYLKGYMRPSPFMLPFNILGEISRTLALAVRLFGNVMSGSMIAGVLLAVVPFLAPVPMQLLGLLTGVVQAYIFAVLALVYVAAGVEVQEEQKQTKEKTT